MTDQTATEPDQANAESLDEALGSEGELIDEIEDSLGDAATEPVSHIELDELNGADVASGATMRDLDLLADVEVEVAVEFGRTRLPLRELLLLRRGSLVELARRPEQKVAVLANGTPIAFGDIVVVGDQLGVHIVELVQPAELPLDDMAAPPVVVAADESAEPVPTEEPE